MAEMRFSSEEEKKAEAELERKIDLLFEKEVELSSFRARLKSFAAAFLSSIGRKMVRLDELSAQSALRRSQQNPADPDLKSQSERAVDRYARSLRSLGKPEDLDRIPKEFVLTEDLKQKFIETLWKVHPDLDPDEGEKLLQKKLTRSARDALMQMEPARFPGILEEWTASPDSTKPPQNLPYFIRFIRKRAQVDERRHHIDSEFRDLTGSEMFKLKGKVEKALGEGLDILGTIQTQLDEEIRVLEEESPVGEPEIAIPPTQAPAAEEVKEQETEDGFFSQVSELMRRGLVLAEEKLSDSIRNDLMQVESENLNRDEKWTTYLRSGQRLLEQRNFGEAERLFASALGEAETFGARDSRVIESLNLLAKALRSQGKYGEIEPLYRRIVVFQKDVHGPDHPLVAKAMGNLAGLCRVLGKMDEAETLYMRSLVMLEKVHGSDHLDVAQNLANLASIFSAQGRHSEAESLYHRLVFSKERLLGPEHAELAADLNNLAMFYHSQGRYDEAEHLYHRAIKIEEKTVGTESPEVAMSLNNLAALYRAYGKYAHAEPHARRSVAINEKYLPPNHPNLAISLKTLASLRRAYGNYREAEEFYRRALEIEEKNLDPDHPDLAGGMNNLAVLYDTRGKFDQAEPLYKRALEIREKVLGPDHLDVALSLNNLAVLYFNLGRFAEAEPLFQRSLKIRTHRLGGSHADVAASLEGYAALLRKTDREPQAEELENQARRIRGALSQIA